MWEIINIHYINQIIVLSLKRGKEIKYKSNIYENKVKLFEWCVQYVKIIIITIRRLEV